ncbi:MAG: methyltransferase [Thermoplasmata archaeon]|nr:methyltransferase [Thermoplasmata archaeon]
MREDSLLLLPFARVARGSSLLEIGCGTGLASLEAASRGARVVATDRNPHALRRLGERARERRLAVDLVRTDLARGLGRFDRVLSNPPYLPTVTAQRDPDRWQNLALDGGPDGCVVTARLVASVADHLTTHGSAFVLVSSLQSATHLASIRSGWEKDAGRCTSVATRSLEGERLEVWRFDRLQPATRD